MLITQALLLCSLIKERDKGFNAELQTPTLTEQFRVNVEGGGGEPCCDWGLYLVWADSAVSTEGCLAMLPFVRTYLDMY